MSAGMHDDDGDDDGWGEPRAESRDGEDNSGRKKTSLARWMVGILVLVPLAFVLVQFMMGNYQSFRVISRSMEPTLWVDDFLIMRRLGEGEFLRGTMVAIENPMVSGEVLAKRVIATGGDMVRLREGRLFVNASPDGVARELIEHVPNQRWRLPEDTVFVVGDNRNDSYDSIDFGPVPVGNVRGILSFRYYPWDRIGWLN